MPLPSPQVAVIGAGISGLAAAHALVDRGARVTVFERRARPGGNVDTRGPVLGDRHVELGVSDLNRATYTRVGAMLDRLGVRYRPMHTSTGFFDAAGEVVYALGRRHGAPPPDDVLTSLRRFRRQAYEALEDPILGALSLDDYLTARDYPERFGRLYLRPRAHALWFCGDEGPGVLPMAMIMRFYALQEGLVLHGDPLPQRMYLPGGVGAFVAALVAALPEGTVRAGVDARVRIGPHAPHVYDGDALVGPFDAVIVATHADEAAALLGGSGEAEWRDVLGRFPYRDTTVVAHTDARLLGPNPNAWGSFNVPIREVAEGPYGVTMVGPLHQNDVDHPVRQGALQPWFFTTANPWRPIPEGLLLRGPDGVALTRVFRHNVMDARALAAAARLPALQGRHRVWVCGGYAHGVGLMEDCWTSAEDAVAACLQAGREP